MQNQGNREITVDTQLKISLKGLFIIYGRGGMGEKMGRPEILATAKRGVLGKVFVIEGGGGS